MKHVCRAQLTVNRHLHVTMSFTVNLVLIAEKWAYSFCGIVI
jgi:hypothetical protein